MAWPVRPTSFPALHADRPAGTALPEWVTNGVLALGSLVLFALAGASAWLSYHAQVAYVLAHNGDHAAQAHVWALLLDAGTAGLSLLRLHETLRGRPGLATRTSLLGCIAASVTMNLLHTLSRTPGGYLVAAVPPVMYAAFLEHVLANLRSLLTRHDQRNTVWRTLAVWVNFPVLMWSARRSSLRMRAQAGLTNSESAVRDAADPLDVRTDGAVEVDQGTVFVDRPFADHSGPKSRRSRSLGAKRLAFEGALVDQVRTGDVRLFSGDRRERNAAAYQAAASLPVSLSRSAARRYVVQALTRLTDIKPADDCAVLRSRPPIG
jgi:hypothetical protein